MTEALYELKNKIQLNKNKKFHTAVSRKIK